MSGPSFRIRPMAILIPLAAAMFVVLGGSAVPPNSQNSRVRAITRPIEFDFADWTLEALADKIRDFSLSSVRYFPEERQSRFVLDYLALVGEIRELESRISLVYSDPEVEDPDAASREIRAELADKEAQRAQLEPVAESILQSQLLTVLADEEFTVGGQALPPILYRTSPPPLALIVSPRDAIRRDHHLTIDPNLNLDEREELEAEIDETLDVSSLSVPVGGVGIYPTLIVESSDINRLAEVVAHEWIHNFLTLRPLGALYFDRTELSTINETVASIAGTELSRLLVARYYPEHLPPPPQPPAEPASDTTPQEPDPPAFDFYREMGETRRTVDELLAEGKVEEAEAYMENRRLFFWDNGYRLRKLNQAYFAFHGSYADRPGGAAGPDPVGEAVRTFREQSGSLAEFVKRISWITSFEGLQKLVTGA